MTQRQTVLLLLGLPSVRLMMSLAFLGPDDGTETLVAYVNESGVPKSCVGTYNPDKLTCVIETGPKPNIREQAVWAALQRRDVEVVVMEIAGWGWRREADFTKELLAAGHRVVWAILSPRGMPKTTARAKNIFARCGTRRVSAEVLNIRRLSSAWNQLSSHLGIPK